MKSIALPLIFTLALTSFYCQQATTPPDNNGRTTISGTVVQRDGATPASGAMISLHPADMLFFPQETGLAKTATITDTILTNNNGVFSVDTFLPPGAYIIEAKQANDITLIDTIEVKSPGQTITTPQATLQPAGVVKGTVILPGGGNCRDIFVLVYGVDRFTRVQDDGSFTLSSLGEGTYSIRIISILQHYGTFDTTDINVTSADTTDLGDIVLPFDGIPIPRNLTAECDTLATKITLHWNRCTATDIIGYVVYRKIADSNLTFIKITSQPVVDTFLTDTTVEQPFRYEYRVAAVCATNEEGTKSIGTTATAASFFTVDTAFDLSDGDDLKTAFAISGEGDYYIAGKKSIQVYDRDMQLKRRIGGQQVSSRTLFGPSKIGVDKIGRAYVFCNGFERNTNINGTLTTITIPDIIYIFNTSGVLMDSICGSTFLNCDFNWEDSLNYIRYRDSVVVYTDGGTRLRSWYSSFPASAITRGGDNRLYCIAYTDLRYELWVFDTIGTLLSKFTYPRITASDDICYDPVRERIYILSVDYDMNDLSYRTIQLRVFDKNNAIIATFAKKLQNVTSDIMLNLHLSDNGEVAILSSWVSSISGGGSTYTYYKQLTRLNPLNRK